MFKTEKHQYKVPNIKLESYKILIVDDNPLNRFILEKILIKFGAFPELAVDGQNALFCAMRRNYDIIFMDIEMPCMNGIEATREIRKLKGKNCPQIIAVTSKYSIFEKHIVLNLGFDDFIPKPIKQTALKEVIINNIEINY